MENKNINLKLKIACSRQVISTVPVNYLSINSEKINYNKNVNINYFYKPINVKNFNINKLKVPKKSLFSCYFSSSCSINHTYLPFGYNIKNKKIFSKGFKNFTYG